MLIEWNEVVSLCKNIKGIIHAGGHTAEERVFYKDIPTIWIEADPELFNNMKVNKKYWFAVTDFNGMVKFNLMPFKASNSILEPNLNSQRRKDIFVEKTIEVPARRIDTIQEDGYNFLNLDIQGAELNALKGTDLSQIDYIYTEFHEVETYKNCTQLNELIDYLKDYQLIRKEITRDKWGDCLFIKKNLL